MTDSRYEVWADIMHLEDYECKDKTAFHNMRYVYTDGLTAGVNAIHQLYIQWIPMLLDACVFAVLSILCFSATSVHRETPLADLHFQVQRSS